MKWSEKILEKYWKSGNFPGNHSQDTFEMISTKLLSCVRKSRMHLQVSEDLPMIDPKRIQVSNKSVAFQKKSLFCQISQILRIIKEKSDRLKQNFTYS